MGLHRRVALLCALAGACLPACAAEVEDSAGADVGVQGQTLAELQVDGARVRFLELEPGAPIALAFSAPGESPLADPAVKDMTLVEMYEHWTHQPAPELLRTAQDRAVVMAQEDAAMAAKVGAELNVTPEAADTIDKLSSEEFAYWYCDGRQICHLWVTGTGEYERYTTRVSGTVNPVYGRVRLQIRMYKVIGGWRNVGVTDVQEDEEVSYNTTTGGIARPLKVKVYEADGDTYHWAHGWN